MKTQHYILTFFILVLFSCKKDITKNQSPNTPLSKIDSLRQLFIPKSDWNGKLKSISIFNTYNNILSNSEIIYYYNNSLVIGQIISFNNTYYTKDSILYKYNTYSISTHGLYDTIEQSYYYGSVYGNYLGSTYSNHALFFDTITRNLSFIDKPLSGGSIQLINRVFTIYNSNTVDTVGYYTNADGLGFIYVLSDLYYTTDSFFYKSYSETSFNSETSTERHSYKNSNIVNTLLLDFMNSLLFLTNYNEYTFANANSSIIYPFPFLGYPNFQFINKIPSSKLVYNKDTNEKISETNYSYDVSGNKINKIVIHTYKYPPVDKYFSDSLVFSYY